MSEHKIVPIEPTKEMLEAHRKYGEESPYIQPYETSVAGYYKAMLAAAPPCDQSENERLRAQVEAMAAVVAAKDEALQACSDAMEYMSEYDIPLTLAENTDKALAIKPEDVYLQEIINVKDAGTFGSLMTFSEGVKIYLKPGDKLYAIIAKDTPCTS